AFRSAATPAEAEDWITHMEKLFQVLGYPDNFKTRLAAFKLEGDALSWWEAHLRTQVGGDAFADTCTWVAFREIFYNKYFSASEQQHYEREYGSICQLDRENSGEYMERLRLPPVTSSYCIRAGIRISGIEMVIGFRTGDRVNRRLGVVMTRVSICIVVVRTRVLSIGVVRIEGKQKQSMSTDLARLPPTTGRVYATTHGQAAKTS
nr:zinc finger, CCHC-type, retrotransposon Gag domain protein [Tanacetum cinerariifolium]